MNPSKNSLRIPVLGIMLLFFTCNTFAQTKRLKRPKSKVGISSVDNFVTQSFDLYDKVYMYDGYAANGTPLDDHDIDVLEDALDDLTGLSDSAPDIISDVDNASVFKQAKATLQINKAQKALKYSIKTAKELLLGQRERDKKDDGSDDDNATDDEGPNNDTSDSNGNIDANDKENVNISDNLEVISKFDFVPGNKLLFFDDFSQDFVGDLPSKWNTNGSGAVVKLNKVEGNWFELKAGHRLYIIPDINELPQDYTIEFDLLTAGLNRQTSSGARLFIVLSDNNLFNHGSQNYAAVSLPLGQYGVFNIHARNHFGKSGAINSSLTADIRDEVKNQPHIAIAVTKKRYRLWVNEVKYIDIPRFIEKLDVLNHLKFHVYGLKDGEERVFIKNLKVAEGGVDLRRELLSKGKVSTNGILFDSGSAKIKPQSYGIIKQISQVLMQDESIKLNIIGHTDSDGSDDANLKLSKDRANAVKEALIKVYNISGNRLQTDGKGEAEPVDDNSTASGKAQNRRVEFVKI